MNSASAPGLSGQVASLHLHPDEGGAAMRSSTAIEVVQAKGILGEPRYFGRINGRTGQPSTRQVSLIEREQIVRHASALGLESIPPGAVRSNIETVGLDLIALVGKQIQVGEAILSIHSPRDPCAKMDLICQGLRELMLHNRQGVLAEVVRSGTIRLGDLISVIEPLRLGRLAGQR